jgi:hypothetical protein
VGSELPKVEKHNFGEMELLMRLLHDINPLRTFMISQPNWKHSLAIKILMPWPRGN